MIILKLLVVFGSYMLVFLFLKNNILAKYIYAIFGIVISLTTVLFILMKTFSLLLLFSIFIPVGILIYYYYETIFNYIKIQAFKQLVDISNVDFSELLEDTRRRREQFLNK